MEQIELNLPFPPSVNSYKKIGKIVKTKNGKLYQERRDSNETKTFYFNVYLISKDIMYKKWKENTYFNTTKYQISVLLYPFHVLPFDIDNRIKVLFDSLVKAKLIYDDSQIIKFDVEKKEKVENGLAKVKISVLN